MHSWVKGIQVCSNEEPLNSHNVKNGFFLLSINICVNKFELFSQVSNVANGPLVTLLFVHNWNNWFGIRSFLLLDN